MWVSQYKARQFVQATYQGRDITAKLIRQKYEPKGTWIARIKLSESWSDFILLEDRYIQGLTTVSDETSLALTSNFISMWDDNTSPLLWWADSYHDDKILLRVASLGWHSLVGSFDETKLKKVVQFLEKGSNKERVLLNDQTYLFRQELGDTDLIRLVLGIEPIFELRFDYSKKALTSFSQWLDFLVTSSDINNRSS